MTGLESTFTGAGTGGAGVGGALAGLGSTTSSGGEFDYHALAAQAGAVYTQVSQQPHATSTQTLVSIGQTLGQLGAASVGAPPAAGDAAGAFVASGWAGFLGLGGSDPVAGAFAALHSPTLEPLDDSVVKRPDQEVYKRIADKNRITVEEVGNLMAFEMQRCGGVPAQQIWDGDAFGVADYTERIALFNAQGLATITPGVPGPTEIKVKTLPAVLNRDGRATVVQLAQRKAALPAATSPAGTSGLPPGAAGFSGGSGGSGGGSDGAASPGLWDMLTTVLKGAGAGAAKGATDAAAGTPLGQQVKRNYLKDWINDNQALALGGVIGLGFLLKNTIANLFSRRNG